MPFSKPAHRSRREQRLSDRSNTSSKKASDSSPQADSEDVEDAPWRALFFFTTKANFPLLSVAILAAIVTGAIKPASAFVQGKMFENFSNLTAGQVTPEELYKDNVKYVLYMVGFGAVSWLSNYLTFAAWVAFGELQAKTARDRIFHGLLEKDTEWYDMRKNGIGALLPRLQSQIRELQIATAQPLGYLVELGAAAILSLAQALYFSWDLTLVTIATVPVIMGVLVWVGAGMQTAIHRQQAKLTEAQKFSSCAFSAIETVKCFNGQESELKNYREKIVAGARHYYRVANMAAIQNGLLVFLACTIFVQGFYYGGVLIDKQKKTPAQIMTCFLSAIEAFQAIQSVLPQIVIFAKGRAAGATLRKVMAQMQERSPIQHPVNLLAPATCHGDIAVRNVSFAYPSRPTQLALDNVSMSIRGGETIYLIGKSGSGKSSLSQLLMGFYECSSGSISVDGILLETLDVTWLRSNLTLVEQTSLLFNDTIHRNVAFGRRDHEKVTREEVLGAVEFALLQLMISDMPDGLDTMVGYKGSAMSGGQRQRMALARARLRDTPILLLDESTSALDHISRGLMLDAIRRWRRGKTTIIITHDISQILPSDYVFVLEHGKLSQEGYRRDIEAMPDTPFQSFLPPEQRATVAEFKRKYTDFESIYTRGTSLDDASVYSQDVDELEDPLEDQLKAATKAKRTSWIPSVFIEGSPTPNMRGTTKFGTTSTTASPFWQITMSPPALPAMITKWEPISPNKRASAIVDPPSSDCMSARMSKMLEGLVSRTGNFAADARAGSRTGPRDRRKPVDKATLAQLTGEDPAPTKKAVETRSDDVVSDMSYRAILKALWPNIDSFTRITLILGFWCGLIHAVASPVFSYIFAKLLSTYAVPEGRAHKTLVYSMAMLGIAFVDGLHMYAFRYLLEYTGQRWVDGLRNQAMTRILDQPRLFFDKESNSVARMTEGLDRNAEEMRNLLGRFIGLLFVAAVTTLVSLVWALAAQWKLSIICLSAAGPYVFLVTNAFSAVSRHWESLSNDSAEETSVIFAEVFTSIKTVRALTLEKHFIQKYTEATNYALKIGFIRAMMSGFFYGMSDSATVFVTALIFYVGSKIARDQGAAVIPDILNVLAILIFAINNVSGALGYIPQIGAAKDTASRLLRLALLPNNSHEHSGDTRITSIGDIEFKDLRFSYPSRPEITILRDINLRIKPGTSTAIVGGSGSGKSTISNLLLNLYCTSSAPSLRAARLDDLTIAGRNIKKISTTSLRSLIVVVSQKPTVFPATVADNITYGLTARSSHATQASIINAARKAGIHDFIISLPSGYNTLIGDGGMGLSGGQAQRVAIARALVRRPSVLILDEATSALDVESATLIRNTIKALLDDRSFPITVIIITHNREQMEIADHIVVLDHGVIVEEGGFKELLTKKGPLTNLLTGGEWDGGNESDDERPAQKARTGAELLMKDVNWKRRSRARPRLRM